MHQTRTVVVVISFGAAAIISLSFFIIYREEQLYRFALIGTVPLTNFLYLLRTIIRRRTPIHFCCTSIIPFITLKEITPVASLKSDSPSIIRFSLFGIGNLLKTAATATASGL